MCQRASSGKGSLVAGKSLRPRETGGDFCNGRGSTGFAAARQAAARHERKRGWSRVRWDDLYVEMHGAHVHT